MSKGFSFYPSLRVSPANGSTREMAPTTKRYHDVPNPLKFLASFQRSEFGPRYTTEVATEAEGHAWTKKMLLENWTTPARKVDEDNAKIPTGTERYAHDGTVYPGTVFVQGLGEPATGTTRGWGAEKWRRVHDLQKAYIRETAEAWARTPKGVEVAALDRWSDLQRALNSDRAPIPGHPGKFTSARDMVLKYHNEVVKELETLKSGWRGFAPAWLENLRVAMAEAATRRDAAVSRVVAP